MNIPDEWFEAVVSNLKENKRLFKAFGEPSEEDYSNAVKEFLEMPYNKEWEIPSNFLEAFRNFFISITAHQCMRNMHPLTCGVGGGSHDILVPRISSDGVGYLVCPTCGWIQNTKG